MDEELKIKKATQDVIKSLRGLSIKDAETVLLTANQEISETNYVGGSITSTYPPNVPPELPTAKM